MVREMDSVENAVHQYEEQVLLFQVKFITGFSNTQNDIIAQI